jgi:hypothetical protein
MVKNNGHSFAMAVTANSLDVDAWFASFVLVVCD